jgi:hypothetical protein
MSSKETTQPRLQGSPTPASSITEEVPDAMSLAEAQATSPDPTSRQTPVLSNEAEEHTKPKQSESDTSYIPQSFFRWNFQNSEPVDDLNS